MSNIYYKIRAYLGRDFSSKEVFLENKSDGKGDYIKTWNVAESQPNDEQLDALDAQATILENNNQVDATRRKEYGNWNDQLDEIYHDIDAWKARLQTIKTNNPKS
mgnify:CR=1 FL=1|jgi:hypothetical protein